NNLLVCGHFGRTVEFDPTFGSDILSTGTTSVALNGFLLKLTADGGYVGAVNLGSPGEYEYARSVKADADGNVYCTGYYRGTMDVDPGEEVFNLTSGGNRDMFLVKYSPDLELLWGINAGGGGNDYGRSLVIDPANGNAYVAASQYSSDVANWGTEDCFNEVAGLPGTNEILVLASYDTDGNPLCVLDLATQQMGFYSAGYQSQMVIRNGDLYFLANFSDASTDFDPSDDVVNADYSGGFWDVALSKYELKPFNFSLGEDLGICNDATITLDASTSDATYFWQDGSTTPTITISEPGTYSVLVNSAGCIDKDSVVVSADLINTEVVQAQNQLTAVLSGATYQWVGCPTLDPIEGATEQSFTALESGEYAVIINSNGCTDTSACVQITVSNIREVSWDNYEIYPNPVVNTDQAQLQFDRTYEDITVRIYSMSGALIQTHFAKNIDRLSFPFRLAPGSYLIGIRADDQLGRSLLIRAR
ncbi:MAG: T9SS type A sorting domain-containing protein, partial [Bacteroidota bacterium]